MITDDWLLFGIRRVHNNRVQTVEGGQECLQRQCAGKGRHVQLSGDLSAKPFRGYGPQDCAQSRAGAGSAGGRIVKSTWERRHDMPRSTKLLLILVFVGASVK